MRWPASLAGEFPEEARSTKQYGRRIRLLPVAMYNCCTCSFDTISRVLSLITGLDLYVGWCLEQHDRAGHRRETEEVKEEVKARLLDEKVVSADETARCCGKNAWIHAASAPGLTLQHASMKRGVLLWACEHGHGQEEGRQNWALELVCFLRSLNSMRKESLERGGRSFRRKTVDNFRERFDELVEEGLAASEAAEELKGGATLRKTRALPRRQEKRKDEFLRFLEDVDVPFTSSEAERDLRSHKGRMAISGCFRTVRGLASHANLSTVIKTLMKAGKSRLEAADAAMNGRPVDLLPPRRSPELES